MGKRILGVLAISAIVFSFGLVILYANDYIEQARASLPVVAGDPQQVVRDYLAAVEKERWEEAFNLYLHPTFRTEAVKLLPIIMEEKPLRKTFSGLTMKTIAAQGNQAIVRVSYTLDMTMSNSNRIQEDVVLNFFVEYSEAGSWQIVFIESVPLGELGF